VKTDELITTLARGVAPVDRAAPRRALAAALAVGGAAAVALMLAWLGPNPALGAYLRQPMFWVKFGFGVLLALAAWPAVRALGRPGAPAPRAALVAAFLPTLALWAMGAAAWFAAAPTDRMALVAGSSWDVCPTNIVVVSAPLLVLGLLATRRAAPTRPALTGAAVGLLAGGVGTAVYALHCPELAAPFLATWYVLGVLICIALGAVAGARTLRW
jgi:hypothetical protein